MRWYSTPKRANTTSPSSSSTSTISRTTTTKTGTWLEIDCSSSWLDLVKEQTRVDDVFGRFGGEEFLLILPRKTRSQARITGEKIRAAVEAYDFPFGDKQPLGKLTISGGVACFPDDGRNSSELIRAADQALYEAKRLGRNRVEAAGDMSLAQG